MGCDDCISRAHINPLQLIITHYAPYYASLGVGLEKRMLLAQKKVEETSSQIVSSIS